MDFSKELNELFTALAIAQGQMKNVTKDKSNPFFKSQYADLASCWEACREPLSKNGLSIIQNSNFSEGEVTINTILAHKSGQWIANKLSMRPQKQDPQGIGSTITYGRRYELMAIVGLAPEDDDGNSASNTQTGKVDPKTEFTKRRKSILAYIDHNPDFLGFLHDKGLDPAQDENIELIYNQSGSLKNEYMSGH